MMPQDSTGMTSLDLFEELLRSCDIMETEESVTATPPLLLLGISPQYSPATAVVTRSLCSVPTVPMKRVLSHGTLHEGGAMTRVDFLALLPPEIAVKILCYLRPRHLCRVVQVSRTWRWLAQYGPLRIKRLRYVQYKREKHLQSKENLYPGYRHLPTVICRTPHSFTQQSVGNTGSPLSSIQSSRSRRACARHSPASSSRRGVRTPPWTPRSLCHNQRHSVHSSQHTPENSDTRERMEDDGFAVRRCLFPLADSASKPNSLVADGDSDLCVSQNELVRKNRASKRRLKRL